MQKGLISERITELKKYQHNVSGKEYIKVTCILMLHKEFSPQDISESLGIDTSTFYRYAEQYRTGGLPELTANRDKGYWGFLSGCQISCLRKELNTHIYTDAQSVGLRIRSPFGITYTTSGVVDLLNRIGFTYKKTNTL